MIKRGESMPPNLQKTNKKLLLSFAGTFCKKEATVILKRAQTQEQGGSVIQLKHYPRQLLYARHSARG